MSKWHSAIVVMFCASILGAFTFEAHAAAAAGSCPYGSCNQWQTWGYYEEYAVPQQPKRSSVTKRKATAKKSKSSRSTRQQQAAWVLPESPCASGNCPAMQQWW